MLQRLTKWLGRERDCNPHLRYSRCLSPVFGALALVGTVVAPAAHAQEQILLPGDAVVTGFSGLVNKTTADPLSGFFIDVDGPSMKILPLAVNEPVVGQHLDIASKFSVKASDVGQVFAITFQRPLDAVPNTPPNIFLGASSAFGLQIVKPDGDADGVADRLKMGHPKAEWMEGQFGAGLGGEPGSIYRVDGVTGDVSLFTTIPGNAGPGLGDVVFDKQSRQFFASDLDTGLIHRISEDGTVLDSFDHGVTGRDAEGLPTVSDDGIQLDIKSPAFDIESSDSWGLTQVERRIWGMAVNGGRLYYAVWGGPQVWSIGINDDGSFTGDARKEFDVLASPKDYPVSDMVFDGSGRLYLAQRGGLQSSFDYSVFAKAKESNVLRYTRDEEGNWILTPEDYAIGYPAPHKNASGGIDLGLSLQRQTAGRGSCDASLWSTGDGLRNVPELDQPRVVHGLQGNETSLTVPDNVPPAESVFVDYDGKFNDPQAEGHVGDVEIWQPCEGRPRYGEFVPPALPPYDVPWDDYTPEIPEEPDFNLTLEKVADPKDCFVDGGGWLCYFTITVTNTGGTDYAGPITVRDWLPGSPAGAWMDFHVQPAPWSCNPATPALGSDFECTHDPVLLTPGDSVELYVDAWVPASYPKKANHCRLRNNAQIVWPFGFGDANIGDDLDTAIAGIPSDECDDLPKKKSDLILKKIAIPNCVIVGGKVRCGYLIDVFNAGAADYNGDIVVKDVLPAGVTMISAGPAPWNCNLITGTCTWPAANLPAGVNSSFFVVAELPKAKAKELSCKVKNTAKITKAPGGSVSNFDPTNDEDSATANVPAEICEDVPPQKTNLKIKKVAVPDQACPVKPGMDWCAHYRITVTNTGPGVFNDFVKIEDTPPAGIALDLNGAGWNCVGNQCETDAAKVLNPNPPSADRLVVHAYLHGTQEQAKAYQCRIENVAKIVSPLGAPKNTNAGDDVSAAFFSLPPHLCDEPPVVKKESNLILRKKAFPKTCDQVADGWKCSWTLEVHNAGPNDFNGPVEINETLPGEPVDATWNGAWNCEGSGGGGGGAICKHPATTINSGGFLTLNLDTVFSNQLVRQQQCSLTNLAEIAKPIGGTAKNTNPADDTAQATATVPKSFCRKEPPRCPPGYELNAAGECVERGPNVPPVVTPPVQTPSCPRPWKVFNSYNSIPKNWQVYVVDGFQRSWYCAKPRPPVQVSCPKGWREIRSVDQRKLKSVGWSIISRGKGKARIWCGLPPKRPPLKCDTGYTKISAKSIASYRRKGWKVVSKRRGKQVIWCARPDQVTIPGPKAYCPKGWTTFPSLKRIPKGWTRKIVRKGKSVAYCGKRSFVIPGGQAKCPRGWKRFKSLSSIPKGWLRKTVRKGNSVAYCGRKIMIDPQKPTIKTCAQLGKLGKWPRCYNKPKRPKVPDLKVPQRPKPSCAKKGMLGKWPNCYKKPVIKKPVRPSKPQIRLQQPKPRLQIQKPNSGFF